MRRENEQKLQLEEFAAVTYNITYLTYSALHSQEGKENLSSAKILDGAKQLYI